MWALESFLAALESLLWPRVAYLGRSGTLVADPKPDEWKWDMRWIWFIPSDYPEERVAIPVRTKDLLI